MKLAFAGISAIMASATAAAPPPADQWDIGPVIGWRNYSEGMPRQPTPLKNGGWTFQFPNPTREEGHVHYLTFRHGSLIGKKRIVMRYRIDAAPGVRFVSQEYQDLPGTLSLYFQREGDNWKANGRRAFYRWYSPDAKLVKLSAGLQELTVSLDDAGWIPVMGGTAATNPAEFGDAKANAERVGFVMGSSRGRGHGVFATGPARFTLLDFRVE